MQWIAPSEKDIVADTREKRPWDAAELLAPLATLRFLLMSISANIA
jgi:hypothetical protein